MAHITALNVPGTPLGPLALRRKICVIAPIFTTKGQVRTGFVYQLSALQGTLGLTAIAPRAVWESINLGLGTLLVKIVRQA